MKQQPRAAARRAVTNENDENSAVGSQRLTRSKAAAHIDVGPNDAMKKTTQLKRTTVTAQPLRKRAVLGDKSNVTQTEAVDSKKAVGKGLSKAAQPIGVTKSQTLSRTSSTRVLGAKDANKKPEPKRTGSGAGAIAGGKRKTSGTSLKEETPAEDEEPKTKRVKEERQIVEESKENVLNAQEPEMKQPVEDVAASMGIPSDVEDLDAEDIDDPLMVAEYVVEIFEYLQKLEIATQPNADYMDHQEDLEWKMRGILVDWLIEVHTRFHLLPETLFLAVNIIDRFLSNKVVQLDRLQLVGVTAMFIASKYEEVLSPHVANFRHVADDGFTEAEILSAERYILGALNYDLSYPNPMNFLRRISKADNYDIQTRTLGKYLMEISLLDHRFMEYLPSHVGAGAMYLARKILDKGEWVCCLYLYE